MENAKYFLPILIVSLMIHCEKPTRSGFDEIKSLHIKGRVIDGYTKKGLPFAKIRFYSAFRPAESVSYSDLNGYYELNTFEVYCSEFVSVPNKIDPAWRANDRYFITATKAGYDTVNIGAYFANIFCFDVDQIVNLSIIHLNYKKGSINNIHNKKMFPINKE